MNVTTTSGKGGYGFEIEQRIDPYLSCITSCFLPGHGPLWASCPLRVPIHCPWACCVWLVPSLPRTVVTSMAAITNQAQQPILSGPVKWSRSSEKCVCVGGGVPIHCGHTGKRNRELYVYVYMESKRHTWLSRPDRSKHCNHRWFSEARCKHQGKGESGWGGRLMVFPGLDP